MQIKGQYIQTLSEVLSFMAPSLGGTVPAETSEEYADWVRFVQSKYEEASRRGFWRRLLKKGELSLTAGDTEALLPIDFQRANSLYILYVDGVDLSDPDREPDEQSIFVEMVTDPDEEDDDENNIFGRWRVTFDTEIETTQTAPIWYFCTPPMPEDPSDKLLLPGDMIGYGAMSEVFRTTNLEGSQDDARNEYENRLSTYLAMEMIPERHEILKFVTNPRNLDRTIKARDQYRSGRSTRSNRIVRSF